MTEDFERCYRAVQSKDPRFDGWFFTAVTSTGIYCRPSCPAMAPKRENVRFFTTAAAAQQAGFRACKRCRPDAAPGSPDWGTRADVVARAMRLIADGVVDRGGVCELAARLGYSTRQLERVLVKAVGAGPLALARAQRAQAARLLVETTDLPMAEIAFAAGFSSIRQFNGTVQDVFAQRPSQMRAAAERRLGHRRAPGGSVTGSQATRPSAAVVCLRLPFRHPFCPDNLFGHLAATAVPGVEEVRDGAYRRTLSLAHGPGIVALRPAETYVWAELSLADLRDLAPAIARCRRLLDLDADPRAVGDLLAQDSALAPLVAAVPGRRVPRTVDEAEMALRAVLGQQVSTAAARSQAGRLAVACGGRVEDPKGALSLTFPPPAAVLEALQGTSLEVGRLLRMPAARRAAVARLAAGLADGTLALGPGADWERARAGLSGLGGIGPWTVEIIAMRALGDPDAFPVNDSGLRKGATALALPVGRAALGDRARAWQPWRSYATQYLWSVLDHPINRFTAPSMTETGPSTTETGPPKTRRGAA